MSRASSAAVRTRRTQQTPRTQPPEVRREQILDAAAEVLVRRGLARATMADVAARAGLAKGTLYLHFGSKDQLVAALQARYQQAVIRQAEILRDGRGGFLNRFDRFLAASFDYQIANIELHHMLFHETGMREEDSMRALTDAVAEALRTADDRGELVVEEPEPTARFLLYGVYGLLLASVHSARPSRRRYLAEASAVSRRLLAPAGN
jgi:AcrR family transcriptional regulator